MSGWGTSAEQWAAWIAEPATSEEPVTTLDAFDADLAERLEAGGFLGNLEQTSVTSPHGTLPPDALDNDATIVRPSPLYDINDDEDEEDERHETAAEDDSGEAAKTMVRGQIPAVADVHDEEEEDEDDGESTLRVREKLDVGLEAPEAGLEVGLESTEQQAEVEGLFIPTLTKPAEQPSTPPSPLTPPVIAPIEPAPPMSSGGTVVAPAPTAPPEEPVIAPSAQASPSEAVSPPDAIDATIVTPTRPVVPSQPVVARTGDTLPPTDTSTEAVQAASSGVFRSEDVHDEEPAPPPVRQKVVIGAPMPAPHDVTAEIDASDLLEASDVDVEAQEVEAQEVEQAAEDAHKDPAASAKPPPPKGAKPPPAPRKGKAPRVEVPESDAPVAAPAPAAVSGAARTPGWPEEVFAEHFTAMTRDSHPALAKGEVEFFLQSTNLQPGARVLDVGCGDGAHALALTQQGFAVTGIDLSPSQINRAQMANEALGGRARFIQCDMRELPTDESFGPFDAILCVGTSFGYYDDEVNRAVLRGLAKHLAPGGRLLLHVFNRDHIIGRLPTRSWWQGRGCLVLDEAQMNYFTSRLAVHRTVVFEDGRQFEHNIKIRGYNANELGRLCVDAGLRVVEISGSRLTRGRFYGASSTDIWLLVEPKA